MEVTSYDGMATNLIIKFAIPPNEENNEWAAYRVTIDSPENSPRFMSVIEIDQKGVETDLGLEYYEWLADCIDEVTVLPTIEQQPVRIAPVSMYWHS